MNEQLVGYIGSIVAGLITNGIQGIFNYITKETLQDRIAGVIESVQKLYEKEYGYRDDSLFQFSKLLPVMSAPASDEWRKSAFVKRQFLNIAPEKSVLTNIVSEKLQLRNFEWLNMPYLKSALFISKRLKSAYPATGIL